MVVDRQRGDRGAGRQATRPAPRQARHDVQDLHHRQRHREQRQHPRRAHPPSGGPPVVPPAQVHDRHQRRHLHRATHRDQAGPERRACRSRPHRGGRQTQHHEPGHQRLVVRPTYEVHDRQRSGHRQDQRVDARPARATGQRHDADAHQRHPGEHPQPQADHRPGHVVRGRLHRELGRGGRPRPVGAHHAAPEGVDGEPVGRPQVERPRRSQPRVEALGRQLAVRGVAVDVTAAHRRGDQQRRSPQQRDQRHTPDGESPAPGEGEAAQGHPGEREQHQAGDPGEPPRPPREHDRAERPRLGQAPPGEHTGAPRRQRDEHRPREAGRHDDAERGCRDSRVRLGGGSLNLHEQRSRY